VIEITDQIAIGDDELAERFVKASGPGGQHVNKTSTACELRFDVRGSASLSDPVKARLERLAGQRLTQDGVIVILAESSRSQLDNRREALGRLTALIRQAAIEPKRRRPTRPTKAARLRRLERKARRSALKARRSRPADRE
jgi:ribosome-associated protein